MIHLLSMVSEIVRILRFTDLIISSLVAAPPSVIGIGDDHANLSTEKDQYDHVMSPFHRRFNPLLSLSLSLPVLLVI